MIRDIRQSGSGGITPQQGPVSRTGRPSALPGAARMDTPGRLQQILGGASGALSSTPPDGFPEGVGQGNRLANIPIRFVNMTPPKGIRTLKDIVDRM